MQKKISILKNNATLTTYIFYTEFLEDVANSYSDIKSESKVFFKLFENGDEYIYNSHYRIDPITIPLLLSLLEQLSKFHKNKLDLLLYNNLATNEVLEFLFRSDFFYICGDNKNPTYPKGRNILNYNDNYIGNFKGKIQRVEHKVRSYSLDDDNLVKELKNYDSEDSKRDFLISHYTYKVREHFEELLFDNINTNELHNVYIDILSELITNGVLHSKSNTFALMFVNKFSTKFSISDNGIGLEKSMELKKESIFYIPNALKKELVAKHNDLSNIPKKILNDLYAIFETLYYSSLKDRKGIFDLMINVVLNSKGYFRLHTENCQVIISNRMMDELVILEKYRKIIYNIHNDYLLKVISEDDFKSALKENSAQIKAGFIDLFNKAISKYNSDIKYSSLRFFKVKFKGVHIEVEIPNA